MLHLVRPDRGYCKLQPLSYIYFKNVGYIWFDPIEGTARITNKTKAKANKASYIWFDPIEGTASLYLGTNT